MGQARIRRIPLWETPQTINATAAITSAAIAQERYLGDAMALRLTIAGSGPSLDVSLTVNDADSGTFVVPYDDSGSSLGAITSTLTASRYIQFTPSLAKHMKITITGDGSNDVDTTVTAYLIVQEDV